MKAETFLRRAGVRWTAAPLFCAMLAIGVYVAACASSSSPTPTTSVVADMSTSPPSPDPRVGLRPGTMKRWEKDSTRRVIDQPAAEAAWNLRLVSNTPPSDRFVGVTNSDLAFTGKYAIQGNYNGYQVWDISNPAKPVLKTAFYCPASQSDVSVYKNLMFVSAESGSARLDCGGQGVPEPVSADRIRGIRIFDGKNITNPKYLTNVQTCRGSHTHTVVHDPNDQENVYIYVSGSSGVRSPQELAGCTPPPPQLPATATQAQVDSANAAMLAEMRNPNSSLFRIEVIQVPLSHPQDAKVVGGARIFQDLTAVTAHAPPPEDVGAGRGGRGGGSALRPTGPRPGPNQCHDITVYPEVGLAGGACGGYGLLLDLRDVKNPRRIDAVADSNFSYWHSATFSNDAKKILFTDEWGGGGAPRCRATDKYEWGGDALFVIENGKMKFQGYFKMPAAQTTLENCVAHNGSLIPIPGREIMAQSWYQGGIDLFEWTDPARPKEIAFHDRGPIDATRQGNAGSWSVYWYNGYLYSSEIGRGLDVFELLPSAFISQNEIDAAKSVRWDELNTQGQPKIVFPATFSLARAYLDQLARNNGLAAARISAARDALVAAERLSGSKRSDALTQLSNQLHGDAQGAADAPKAHMLAYAVGDLAKAKR